MWNQVPFLEQNRPNFCVSNVPDDHGTRKPDSNRLTGHDLHYKGERIQQEQPLFLTYGFEETFVLFHGPLKLFTERVILTSN